eukprot:s2568_g4.t1
MSWLWDCVLNDDNILVAVESITGIAGLGVAARFAIEFASCAFLKAPAEAPNEPEESLNYSDTDSSLDFLESEGDATDESFVVECATCSVQYPWNELTEGRRVLPVGSEDKRGVSQQLVDENSLEQYQSELADCADDHLSASSSQAGTASTSVSDEAGNPGSEEKLKQPSGRPPRMPPPKFQSLQDFSRTRGSWADNFGD